MTVEKPLHIAPAHQLGQLPLGCRGHFTHSLPDLGRNEAQTERLVEGLLVRRGHELAAPPECGAVEGKPFVPA